jgi:hypothetical protein
MATWTISPAWKKSIIERNYLTNADNTVMIETGWRWGSFSVETEDDKPPVIEPGTDLYDCDYEVELIETTDGCWEEVDSDGCDDETKEWLEEFFDEGNSWLDLEEHGWSQDDCEMIIDCDIIIEDENGNKVETSNEDETETDDVKKEPTIIAPGAIWPFEDKK